MPTESLKHKTVSGFIWSFLDKIGQQLLLFVTGIILARLLSVEDFGLMGVLTIFTALANLVQESGFSSALIRAKNVSEQDYSSVFYFNIGLSICIYGIYFVLSTYIAEFYDKSILTNLSRVVFLSFIFNALGIVQNIHIVKNMEFKQIMKINFFSGLFSVAVALVLLWFDCGVWALAGQQIGQAMMRMILLWSLGGWTPILFFSFKCIRKYFLFSVKLLMSGISSVLVGNILSIIIGKFYSVTQVGYYSQANRYYNFALDGTTAPINTVSFPMLAEAKNQGRELKRIYRKTIRFAAFLNFPVMLGIIGVSKSFVITFLGVKWEPSVSLLVLFCIYGAFAPFPFLFSNLLKTIKMSGRILQMEFFREILVILSLLLCLHSGIFYLLLGITISNLVQYICYVCVAGRTINYTLKEHLIDIGPYLVIALGMLGIVTSVYILPLSYPYLFLIQILVGALFYLGINRILNSVIQKEILDMIKSHLLNKFRR